MILDKFKKDPSAELVTVTPSVNIFEKDNEVALELDMPGADKEALDVNLEGNTLTVRGRTRKDDIPKEYQPLYTERRQVGYERRFELNIDIDRGGIKADFIHGVLTVRLPKAQSAQPRKIEIKS